MECGTRLASGCPNCGAQNPPEAKFCGECGTTLASAGPASRSAPVAAADQSSAVPPTAERRLVTVLFADLVGSTTLAQNEDPEDTREFLTSYFDLARTIVERYGGTIEKFIGDAVMAVWGTPTTHEDDAERAVRAALEIVNGVPSLGDGRGVEARAGVLTGQAAVTIGASGQGMVAGDLVNTASRLQSVAPPGAVLVGEATYRAAGSGIRFEEAGEQLLNGKTAPLPAWRVAAVVGLRGGSGRNEALEPPFTGRDDELRLVKELFHATERENKARLVSIVGQGGMGKSRLAWEFEKYVDGVVGQVWWHVGRSPAYGEGISYWALAEMVRGRAGIAESDDSTAAAERLREAVVEWIRDEQERAWVAPRLAALLALEPMPAGSRDELFAAWRTFFDRIAQRGPTVLVFEDVQWADEGMLDFITELLDRSRNLPIFVVTIARPELFDRRPAWGANLRSLTSMTLDPLDREQMAQLVTGTVPGIPTQATSAIVDRADGIPLYAVETMRMLLDRGDLRRTEAGTFAIEARLDTLAVPDTLQALIAARLDTLGEHDRRLAQAAAVLGQSFTIDALAAVTGESVEALRDHLTDLVRRQILRVEVDRRSPERGQYQFVQAVVREVAEASLGRSDRRALHVAAARYYETLGDDELAGVLASHYVQAYRTTSLGPEADALAAQARVSLRAAAERAIELHSNRQAVSYLRQALAVTTDPLEQAALHERAAEAALNEGLESVAMEHAGAVEALARERGDRLAILHGVTLQANIELSHHREQAAIALLTPALDEVADLEPGADLVNAYAELARALMIGGKWDQSLEWCDRVLARSDLASGALLMNVLATKGTVLTSGARYVEGEILLRGVMDVAEHNGDIAMALRARNNVLGIVSVNDPREATAMIEEGYGLAISHGLTTWALQFASLALDLAFMRGDWDAHLDEVRALEPSGFYAGWLVASEAMRAAYRQREADARDMLAHARDVAAASTQAEAGIAGVEALIEFVAGNWEAAIVAARSGWTNIDNADFAIEHAVAAAAAANRADWAREAVAASEAMGVSGRYQDAVRTSYEAIQLMLEGRWTEARSAYLSARRVLEESDAQYQLALLNMSVGARANGEMPEAVEAAAAAREFFTRVGAASFLDRYQAAFVHDEAAPRARPPATATAASVAEA
jgi:class 3 adenylate cyclase